MTSTLKREIARFTANKLDQYDIIGLGSGSTVNLIIKYLADAGSNAHFISGSTATSRKLQQENMVEISPDSIKKLPVLVDGADEIYLHKNYLLKGHGAALLREKLLWHKSEQILVAVDASKLHDEAKNPIPIEVSNFDVYQTLQRLSQYGKVTLQTFGRSEMPLRTDNGNFLIFLDPNETDLTILHPDLKLETGVIETGIFGKSLMNKCTILMAKDDGIREF